jgi:putative ABC transport system substrate-binding protein
MARWAHALCILVFALAPLIASGQPARKLPRLCFLTFEPAAARTTRFAEFFDSLRELGLADGETMVVDWMSAEGDGERFPGLAAECVKREAGVIVTTTTPATQAAKAATITVPIVMLGNSDAVATGLIASLARPGGNVTGTSVMMSELATKRLELLCELIPGLSRVLLLVYSVDPIFAPQLKALEVAARQLNVDLIPHEVRTAADIPAGYNHGAALGAQAVLTTNSSIFTVEQPRIIDLSAKFHLAAVYPSAPAGALGAPRAGGLVSYGTKGPQRLTATYVERVLQGAKPADLPVEQPTRFELIINLRTAEELGITVPSSILARADDVIK